MELSNSVEALRDECIRVRRELHSIPETAYNEIKTQAYVMEYMSKLAPDVLVPIAGTGVKAVYYAKHPQSTIAFRADMDALPVKEATGVQFASTHIGYMHACGHDGHMSALLMLARLVSSMHGTLKCNVVLLFQPGEEGGCGAQAMIDDGALNNPHIERIYGMHIWPELERGKIGTRSGAFMAQSCGFNITVCGKSAHGAKPEMGIDAIVAAAQIITALQTVVSRSVSADEPVVVSIGSIMGGEVRNVICDKVELKGTLRVFSDDLHDNVYARIRDILRGAESAFGVKTEFIEVQRYYCVNNDPALTKELVGILNKDAYEYPRVPLGEDFSFYQRSVSGVFFFVGSGEPNHNAPLHSPKFDFDETVLLNGVEVYRRILDAT
ncbi:MAG: M20 family metallopeptidase [Clostridia bacterium]